MKKATKNRKSTSYKYSELLNSLSDTEKSELLTALKRSLSSIINKDVTVCPCCNATNFKRNGTYKGIQKYLCKTTSKVFNFKTNTVVSGIGQIEKVEELLNWLGEGSLPTILQIKERLNISVQTAFDWRTKILTALYNSVSLKGQIIEFDEIHHHLSRKGRRGLDKRYSRRNGSKRRVGSNSYTDKIFIAYSRSTGKLDLQVSHIGGTNADNVRNYLEVNKELVVYSDKNSAYEKYYKNSGIEYKNFLAKDHVSKDNRFVHTQAINSYSGQLNTILNHNLHGVSTKHLQGYCNWFSFFVNYLKDGVKPIDVLMNNKIALDVHKQKEKEFKMLLKNSHRSNFGTCKERYKLSK